jgi:membrane-bound lytic murein transglycosylase D
MIPVASKSLPSYTLSKAQRKRAILNSPRSGRIKLVHNVQQGDTWWDLARHYHVGVRSLAKWNASSPRDVLREGDKLVVWIKPGRNIKVSSQSVPAAPQHKPIIQRINYRVRIGDSLARIAGKFNVRVRDLLKWNRLSVKSYLQPGQRIKLFVDITSQSGV